jgi:hypothetical protein
MALALQFFTLGAFFTRSDLFTNSSPFLGTYPGWRLLFLLDGWSTADQFTNLVKSQALTPYSSVQWIQDSTGLCCKYCLFVCFGWLVGGLIEWLFGWLGGFIYVYETDEMARLDSLTKTALNKQTNKQTNTSVRIPFGVERYTIISVQT